MKYIEVDTIRPDQFRGMLGELPVSYVQFSALEWRAEHNPLGLDGLKSGVLCCARVCPSRAR